MITGRTLGLCIALAVCAWAAAAYRDSEQRKQQANSQLQQQPAVVLHETGIKAGKAAATEGGAFTIRVDRISGSAAKLTVASKTGDVYRFDKVQAGSRLVVPAPDALYDVDVIRIHGNVVDVMMSKRR